jgi:hypothetical protein
MTFVRVAIDLSKGATALVRLGHLRVEIEQATPTRTLNLVCPGRNPEHSTARGAGPEGNPKREQ